MTKFWLKAYLLKKFRRRKKHQSVRFNQPKQSQRIKLFGSNTFLMTLIRNLDPRPSSRSRTTNKIQDITLPLIQSFSAVIFSSTFHKNKKKELI